MPASFWSALAEAHDTNYADFSTGYARRAGSHLRRGRSFDRAIIDLPAPPYNGVFRSNLPKPTLPRSPRKRSRSPAPRRVPVVWRVTPTTPAHTSPALDALGWHAVSHTPVMARQLDTVTSATTRPR